MRFFLLGGAFVRASVRALRFRFPSGAQLLSTSDTTRHDKRTREDRVPVPAPVLRNAEEEVGADDGGARDDDEEHDKGQEREAVDVVELVVVPEGAEDKVHLHEDGEEGREPREQTQRQRVERARA